MHWIKSPTTLYMLVVIVIVAMAIWTPIARQNAAPVSIQEITRLNDTLPDGTLVVPRGGVVLGDGTQLASVAAIGRRGDVVISNDNGSEKYQVVWLNESGQYLIYVQQEPFVENRDRAAAEYLSLVGGGSVEEACKRNVLTTAAPWLSAQPQEPPKYCNK